MGVLAEWKSSAISRGPTLLVSAVDVDDHVGVRNGFFVILDEPEVALFEGQVGVLAAVGIALDELPVDHAHLLVVELEPLPVLSQQHRVVPGDAVVAVVHEDAVQIVGVPALDLELGLAEAVHVEHLREGEAMLDFLVDFGLEIELAATQMEHEHLRQVQEAHSAVGVLLAPLVGGVLVVPGQLFFGQKLVERVFDRIKGLREALETQLNVDEVFLARRAELDVSTGYHLLGLPVEERLDQVAPRVFGADRRLGERVHEVFLVRELLFQIVHQQAAELLDVLLHEGRFASPPEGLDQLGQAGGPFGVLQVQEEPVISGEATFAVRR